MKSIKVALVILLINGCENYNFKYYLNDNGSKKLIVKGQINSESIPNGRFVFYNEMNREISRGNYVNGVKEGEWNYSLNGEKKQLIWSTFEKEELRLPILEDWISLEDTLLLFTAAKYTLDSVIVDRLGIRIRDLDNYKIEDFDSFEKKYKAEAYDKNSIVKFQDYSREYREYFVNEKISYFEYDGIDKAGEDYKAWFFLVQLNDSKQVMDIFYISKSYSAELHERIFNDVIVDTYYKGQLIVGQRWGNLL